MSNRKSAKSSLNMMRSFCTMAQRTNLSKAAEDLGLTRQTIRRHIFLIEESRGQKLFTRDDRKYHLTEAGQMALSGAEEVVTKGLAWLKGQYDVKQGLSFIQISDEDGKPLFFSHQRKLSSIWKDGTGLLQQALQCWVEAKGIIESDKFAPIRPYILVFRRFRNEWLCAEIGEKSALAMWHGWEWAKSSVGRHIEEIPASKVFSKFIIEAYDDVQKSGSPRLDHQFRNIARRKEGELCPISYQRLLLSCEFPDGDLALVSVVEATQKVKINNLPQEYINNSNTTLS